MKPSIFNVVTSALHADEVLIFNTFTDARVVVNLALKAAMDKAGKGAPLTDEESAYLGQLKDAGIMVDDTVDEERELEYWFQRLKYDTTSLDVTVLTTSACNLGCTYCFEDGINLKGFMTEPVCQQAGDWITARLDEVRPRILHLTLFGGEPLLNPKAALELSRRLYRETARRGMTQQISVITNGVLLTEQLVDDLLAVGLSRVKVTLDGDEQAHDSKRRYKNGKGSFRVIIDNLLRLKGKAPISIGGNFDETTRDSIPRLLDQLVALGFTSDDIMDISFKPILNPTNKIAVLNNSMDSGHSCTFSDTKAEDFLWLRDEVERRGFATKDGIAIGPCCATKEQTFTIDPWGKIYKCPALVGRESFIIGDVAKTGLNGLNTKFMTVDLWRDPFCSGCSYRPIC
ncbi:MAG: radical SAM protein, partial [Nitrospirae bacterium]|nr:radical SAM protein [Nitrospirota bacterium]